MISGFSPFFAFEGTFKLGISTMSLKEHAQEKLSLRPFLDGKA